jgi:hypothetical protein
MFKKGASFCQWRAELWKFSAGPAELVQCVPCGLHTTEAEAQPLPDSRVASVRSAPWPAPEASDVRTHSLGVVCKADLIHSCLKHKALQATQRLPSKAEAPSTIKKIN